MNLLKRAYIKWLIWRGKAVDIWSKSVFPANVLSNLCSNGFRFEGRICGSMEGFLQSLKYKDIDKQRQICSMKGKNAKKMTINGWQTDQIVWWKGNSIDRQSSEYLIFIRKAYQSMFEQNERFRTALMATRGMKLYHSKGEKNPFKTILTEKELCNILTDIREKYDKRDKQVSPTPKRIFINLENLEADKMNQMIELINNLQPDYDLYMLYHTFSQWAEINKWIKHHFGNRFEHRTIIVPNPSLCQGDYLITLQEDYIYNEFKGEIIMFGNRQFSTYQKILEYLISNK